MNLSDKPEFDKNLEILFGGFPAFLTDPRKEAYWRGLQKMPLHGFIRCVDFLLGEESPEKLPTLHGIWTVYKQQRALPIKNAEAQKGIDTRDKYDRFADHIFLNYLMRSGGVAEDKLTECLSIKKQVAADYRLIGQDEIVEPEEMRNELHKRWKRCCESKSVHDAIA